MSGSPGYHKARYDFAMALMDNGAVLTIASDSPLVVERKRPGGKERGFKLKLHEKNPGAPLSPFYLNLRTLRPGTVATGARCMRYIQQVEELQADAVAGVPQAGNPFARVLAGLAGLSSLELEKREYNDTRSIVSVKGHVPPSVRRALVVDDLITEADSKREAVQVLRNAGVQVFDVIVLIDREQNGRKELAKMGCRLHAVFTVTELFDLYVAADKMEPQMCDMILAYLRESA